MCGFFSRTPPPELNKKDLELGLGKSLTELFELRISNGFKILENVEHNYYKGHEVTLDTLSRERSLGKRVVHYELSDTTGLQALDLVHYSKSGKSFYLIMMQD